VTDLMNPLRTDGEAIPTLVAMLKKELGVRIAKLVLSTDGATINKWIKGTVEPTANQKRLIYSAGYVINVLKAYVEPKELKLWMVSHSEYLYGIPAMELRHRPEDVQNAALNRVSRGEHHELLAAQLSEG